LEGPQRVAGGELNMFSAIYVEPHESVRAA
jgi:hypothetical protein